MQDFAMIKSQKSFHSSSHYITKCMIFFFFQYRQNLISEKLTLHQMAALGLYSSLWL